MTKGLWRNRAGASLARKKHAWKVCTLKTGVGKPQILCRLPESHALKVSVTIRTWKFQCRVYGLIHHATTASISLSHTVLGRCLLSATSTDYVCSGSKSDRRHSPGESVMRRQRPSELQKQAVEMAQGRGFSAQTLIPRKSRPLLRSTPHY